MAYDDALEDGERDLDAGRDDFEDDDRDEADRGESGDQSHESGEGDDGAAGHDGVEDDGEETDEDSAEARAARRRAKRKAEKEWRRRNNERNVALIQQQQREIAELRAMVSGVVQRTDMEQLDTRLTQAQTAYRHAQERLRNAIEGGDIDQQIKLQDELYTARRSVDDLTMIKERAAKQPQQQQPSPEAIRQQAYYDGFVARNQWFDPSGRDEDSRNAIEISNRIAAAGIPAHDPRHWAEIDRQLKAAMPHRFDAKPAATQQRQQSGRSPIGGSGGSRSPQPGGAADERRIPRAYREMLEQTGDWHDPKRRKAMVDEYFASAKRHGV